MSVPSSLKVGPFVSSILLKKIYLIIYFSLMWITITTVTLEFWLYWQWLWNFNSLLFLILLPVLFFTQYISSVLVSLFFAKFFLVIVNLVHPPKEGVFKRSKENKDYRYWCIRNIIKRWPIWLAHKFPYPFLDNLCFKLFGVKTFLSNSLFEGWVDCEFIDFGKNVRIGKGSVVQSSVIIGNLLIVRKTIIEDNVHIGAHTVVMPGTHIGKKTILASSSATVVGQELEARWIYIGIPAKKYRLNPFFDEGVEDKISSIDDPSELQARLFGKYFKGKHEDSEVHEKVYGKPI